MCQQQKGQPQSLSVLLQSCYMFNSLQLSSPAVLAAPNQGSYIAAALSTSYNATKVPAGDLSVEQTSHRRGQTGHHNFLIRWLIRLGAWHSVYLTTSFPGLQARAPCALGAPGAARVGRGARSERGPERGAGPGQLCPPPGQWPGSGRHRCRCSVAGPAPGRQSAG